MADKNYKLLFDLSDGTTKEVRFTAPQGDKGDKGDPGEFAIGDQEAIVQQVIAALGTPVFGRVDAENNIILSGELVNGTYTLKYEDGEGNVTVIGTLNASGGSDEPAYINLVDTAEAPDSTAIYNDIGYRHGYYISSSSGHTADATNGTLSTATGLMPFAKDTTYYVKGGQFTSDYSPARISLYNESKTLLGQVKASEIATYGTKQDLNSDGSYFKFTLTSSANMVANAKYFAITLRACYSKPTIATVDFVNL